LPAKGVPEQIVLAGVGHERVVIVVAQQRHHRGGLCVEYIRSAERISIQVVRLFHEIGVGIGAVELVAHAQNMTQFVEDGVVILVGPGRYWNSWPFVGRPGEVRTPPAAQVHFGDPVRMTVGPPELHPERLGPVVAFGFYATAVHMIVTNDQMARGAVAITSHETKVLLCLPARVREGEGFFPSRHLSLDLGLIVRIHRHGVTERAVVESVGYDPVRPQIEGERDLSFDHGRYRGARDNQRREHAAGSGDCLHNPVLPWVF
jgi:hypothetical protein